MFLITICYALFALCLFATFYVLMTYEKPGKLHNWEIIVLIIIL